MIKDDYEHYGIVPRYGVSPLDSRRQPRVERPDFFGLYPIISAPMKSVSGPRLVVEMAKCNAFGILHRAESIEKRKEMIWETYYEKIPFGVAVGIDNFQQEYEIIKFAWEHGANMICVDLANGYLKRLADVAKAIFENFPEMKLMTGNVITGDAANMLHSYGYDYVRVSIGSGSVCSTRAETGIHRNALVAIKDCSKSTDAYIVADGGIKEPGHAAKAFVAGADMVMLGRILASAEEANNDGIHYGMASKKLHDETDKEVKSIEGYETKIEEPKQPLKEIISRYVWGLKSAMTYIGAWNITDMPNCGKLVSTNERIENV